LGGEFRSIRILYARKNEIFHLNAIGFFKNMVKEVILSKIDFNGLINQQRGSI
jgi:hypothetical protein